jgi:hypothetical protein
MPEAVAMVAMPRLVASATITANSAGRTEAALAQAPVCLSWPMCQPAPFSL